MQQEYNSCTKTNHATLYSVVLLEKTPGSLDRPLGISAQKLVPHDFVLIF